MKVLFRAPIIRTEGWEFRTGGQSNKVGAADVIDLTNSDSAEAFESLPQEEHADLVSPRQMLHSHVYSDQGEVKDSGFYQIRYTEPVLSVPLEKLQKIAESSGGLINERNYPEMHVQAGGVNWQGARLFPAYAPDDQGLSTHYNALPDPNNAHAIHDGFNLFESPQTSMKALVHKLVPENPMATWQINPATREFLILG